MRSLDSGQEKQLLRHIGPAYTKTTCAITQRDEIISCSLTQSTRRQIIHIKAVSKDPNCADEYAGLNRRCLLIYASILEKLDLPLWY